MNLQEYIEYYEKELVKLELEEKQANTDMYANIKHVDADRVREIIGVLKKL